MSIQRGLSSEEYGGAHEKHDTGLDVNNTAVSDCNFIKTEEFSDDNNTVHILSFQDGDIIDKSIESDNDNVQSFLSGELDSFHSNAQNNVDWLRDRTDNVNFEIPSSSEDDSDLFEGSVTGLSGTDAGILCNDVSAAQMFISPINQTIFSTAETNLVQSQIDAQQIASAARTECIQANVVDQFTSTVDNIELTENVDLGTQATILHSQNDIESLSQNSTPQVSAEEQVVIRSATGNTAGEPTILLAPPANMTPQYIQATTIPQTIQVIPPSSGLPQTNLKFATISISTDKPTNSTHILVNTNQGNQLYKINTEDLQQASNSLSPTADSITQPNTLQTGYLVLNPDPSSNGMVNVLQMDGGPPKVIHNVLKSVENKKVFVCPIEGCQKMFRRMSKYKTHQMRHTGERPYKCSKPGCEWAFTTHYKLKRHEESHQGKKDFMCPIEGCGGKFTTVYNLNSHIKLHSRPCTEKCPVEGCMEMFATKRQLDVHMKSHAGHEKTFKCPHEGCDKVFASPLSMGSHPRVHLHHKEDLICKFEGCGKKFDKVCRLNQHMRSHTGEKPYVCTFEKCNWAFTTASKLKRHEAKHTGLRKWVCDICGKGFMRSEHLKGHKITHSGDKPFACPIEGCDIKFTAKSSLFVHMKRHENGGKKVTYHCPMEGCLKKYSNKPSLRAHIVKHVKQVMSENNNAQSDGANLDIMPYLDSDLPEIGLLASIDGPNTTEPDDQPVTTSSESVQSTSVTEPANVMIDPSEFIASSGVSEPSFMTSETGEVQQISPEVISQILSSMEKQDQMASHVEPQATQAKLAKGSKTSGGSARTDYHANQLMSERARKRRNKESSLAATENSFQADVAPKNNFMTDTFPSSDSMTSRGITFRDPETGVLYLQTQLLQDDPPNTELYSDDVEISPDLPVTSCTPLHDSNTEFTGSTINLQDLE